MGYAIGLMAAYAVMTREARRRGPDPAAVDRGVVAVAVAAVTGGRAYRVVDKWDRYAHDPMAVVWYSLVRLCLEGLHSGNWTLGGVPTATVLATVLAVGALAVLAWRHRPASARRPRRRVGVPQE